MAKSIIKNILGIRSFNFALPADENVSKIFADRFLEGQYEIYKPILKSENEVGSQIWDVTITGKSSWIRWFMDRPLRARSMISFRICLLSQKMTIRATFTDI